MRIELIASGDRRYPRFVIGTTDVAARRAAFEWLAQEEEERGPVFSWARLTSFRFNDEPVPLIGQRGIWKPKACELPVSICTSIDSPYGDGYDPARSLLRYAYRGTDPENWDNRLLRRAMRERIPLIYFYGVGGGAYAAIYPVFIVGDEPQSLMFLVQVDDASVTMRTGDGLRVAEDPEPRRAYVTTTARRRLHQVAFRERVLRAYLGQCALCRLRHAELLDAAHITPDRESEGEPVTSNGLSLCKLHHAAFDAFFFAVRPDYSIEVRQTILAESDGPMLVVGLQEIHGKTIVVPRQAVDRPDIRRLEQRYEHFRAAV